MIFASINAAKYLLLGDAIRRACMLNYSSVPAVVNKLDVIGLLISLVNYFNM
jgi:hypothetical protein